MELSKHCWWCKGNLPPTGALFDFTQHQCAEAEHNQGRFEYICNWIHNRVDNYGF